jgi:hypothetical protein
VREIEKWKIAVKIPEKLKTTSHYAITNWKNYTKGILLRRQKKYGSDLNCTALGGL